MNEVKTKMYLNALKVVFPYDNKAMAGLINRKKNESDSESLINQNSEICPQWLEHVFHRAGTSELLSLGLTEVQARTLVGKRASINPEAEYALLLKENITLINQNSPEYPEALNMVYDAPEILYVQGRKSMLINQKSGWNLAIVGTRTPSMYGKEITERIVRDLKPFNPTVVSGLAIGIDQAAHEAAIANGLPTIAVLGAGHGSLKPKYGFRLIKKLLDENLIVSEYPYNTEAHKGTFPKRNRIIAGLSLATLVIEARERSGALITAGVAHGYGREVFAVPGSILSAHAGGTNGIIQKRVAELFSDVPSMVKTLNLQAQLQFTVPSTPAKKIKPQIDDPLHEKIYNHLRCPTNPNELFEVLDVNIQEALIALTQLELQGLVKELPDQRWIRMA